MLCIFQTITPEELKSTPIIFGDFMQVDVPTPDRVYKEITNMTKLQSVLNQVRNLFMVLCRHLPALFFFFFYCSVEIHLCVSPAGKYLND